VRSEEGGEGGRVGFGRHILRRLKNRSQQQKKEGLGIVATSISGLKKHLKSVLGGTSVEVSINR